MSNEQDAFGLHSIGQILVPVEDVEASTAFYRDVLGMRFLFAFPGIAFFDCDGVRLYLAKPPGARGPITVYYRVDDIHAAVAALEARGAAFFERPEVAHRDERHELWLAFLKDPAGNNVGLMSEVQRTPAPATGG